jgi:hypothetical protein
MQECGKDEICPKGGAAVLDQQSLMNLLENITNSEAYIEQLKALLHALTEEPEL